MDSLTQAVLGAAVGEAFLGRKLGNRAMLWGALVGTFPDLDVIAAQFAENGIYGLKYHRGLSHSILVTVLMPILLAWGAKKYYDSGANRNPKLQRFFSSLWIFVYAIVLLSSGFFLYSMPSIFSGILFVLLLLGSKKWYVSTKRVEEESISLNAETTFKEWYLMFFFGWFTHWLIDACTAYGTQIFEPFSGYRIAFNNIAIVDPLYTLPFLIFLTACYFSRTAVWRKIFVSLALGLSTGYMAFTFVLKNQVNDIVNKNIALQSIEAIDYVTTPTMFNTILWQVTIETKDSFYYGMYSFLDKTDKIKLASLPKNHELLAPYKDNELVQIILWFVQGMYNVLPAPDGNGVVINNLRFGIMATSKEDMEEIQYGMGYRVEKTDEGNIVVYQGRGFNASTKEESKRRTDMMTRFMTQTWVRLQGIEDFELKTETLVPIAPKKEIEFKQIEEASTTNN